MELPEKRALSAVRYEHAQECFDAAKNLIAAGQYKSAANRLYYSVFHGMRAVLAFDGIDMKHHSGIISEFRKRYIKASVFDKKLSGTISLAYDMRTGCDYDDHYILSKGEVHDLIAEVDFFLEQIKTFIDAQ